MDATPVRWVLRWGIWGKYTDEKIRDYLRKSCRMKLAKLVPLLLLQIHFFVYLAAANFRLISFNIDAILLGFFFGIPFWWIFVYPIYCILGPERRWRFWFAVAFPLAISLFFYGVFSFDIAPDSMVAAGSRIYVENGIPTELYVKEVFGQIFSSVVGVLIGIPLFFIFLNDWKNKDA